MKKLLEFMVSGILGKEKFTIEEDTQENYTNYLIKVAPESTGLLIGKGGNTIKAIRKILKVRAAIDKKGVSVEIN